LEPGAPSHIDEGAENTGWDVQLMRAEDKSTVACFGSEVRRRTCAVDIRGVSTNSAVVDLQQSGTAGVARPTMGAAAFLHLRFEHVTGASLQFLAHAPLVVTK
jgi:hypothetical protein